MLYSESSFLFASNKVCDKTSTVSPASIICIFEELDGRKQELVKKIAELSVDTISPEQVKEISGYLDTWEEVDFDDKRRVVDLMISAIYATSESINIVWKI